MSDFHIDPYKGYRVDKVKGFKEKRKTPPTPEKNEKDKSKYLAVAYGNFLLKVINKLSKKRVVQSIEKIKKDLNTFKEILQQLEKNDLSQNIDFLKHLSAAYLRFSKKATIFLKKTDAFSKKVQALHQSIHAYPESVEFSLGYYLSEYAGLNWVPFPFMDMLHKLYEEHQKDSKNSQLQKWVDLLENF